MKTHKELKRIVTGNIYCEMCKEPIGYIKRDIYFFPTPNINNDILFCCQECEKKLNRGC